ncbi:hypothetical protein BOX15_Mlig033507g1 [Macrostomum lignano]|uniref:Transporter n=2 Tax=Macrostomum lignano TaxID=282301 RepID=A0A1I8HHA3_9PLAT|nr:hypothetical protein BOX15_Mlig033507g1 [Macrostomum lignano]
MSTDVEKEGGPQDVTFFQSDANLKCTRFEPDTFAEPKEPQKEEVARQSWGGKAEFLFSCLSYAVGLGNVWRFPYLCYKNGGGAFLIPFASMLLFVGIPLMYMETCFGQYSATGPITVWKASPLFTGIGWSMILVTFFGSIYYNMLLAWTLMYFWKSITSFSGSLPWTTCSADWNPGNCMLIRTMSDRNRCWRQGGFFAIAHNHSCLLPDGASWLVDESTGNATAPLLDELYSTAAGLNSSGNVSQLARFLGTVDKPRSPSDLYFHNFVLSISNGFHDLGFPKWELVLCLFAAWVVVILCLIRGVKSAGKAVYFTSLFPYLVLTILLIRGLTLEGSMKGLEYFFVPKWDRLADPNVWGDAAIQVFFSLSSGWGGIIALSSYNQFHNNALLDALIVSFGDGATSVYSGMTVFCVLGYMSHVMSLPINAVAKDGAGLAFILYPDIVTSLPLSPFWASLFFAMLLTLGFGTMISNVNTLKTALCDNWSSVFNRGQRPLGVLIGICFVAFILGLPCTTRGGMFVLQLLDNYCCTYSVLVVGFAELMVITWVYGADRFLDNVAEMRHGRPVSRAWKYIWKYFSPLVIVAVATFTYVSVKPSKYANYTFPKAADILGAIISVLVITPIPGVAAYKIYQLKSPEPIMQKVRLLSQPDREWGREMGRKPAGYYAASDPAAAYESQQPLTATGSYINSSSTNGAARVIVQNRI